MRTGSESVMSSGMAPAAPRGPLNRLPAGMMAVPLLLLSPVLIIHRICMFSGAAVRIRARTCPLPACTKSMLSTRLPGAVRCRCKICGARMPSNIPSLRVSGLLCMTILSSDAGPANTPRGSWVIWLLCNTSVCSARNPANRSGDRVSSRLLSSPSLWSEVKPSKMPGGNALIWLLSSASVVSALSPLNAPCGSVAMLLPAKFMLCSAPI